jgi:PBSX family phage terminase large subunit
MHIDDLVFVKFDSETGHRVYKCPMCGGEIRVHESVFYGRCNGCLATIIDYKPAPYQVKFHQSKAKFRLNIGGYGSGKTTMDAAEIATHALSVSNGRTLITAQTLQQIREAVLPELEKFLPPWFFDKPPTYTPLPKYKLTNGHEIICYASDNEEKLRSLNLTAFWIVEASGVAFTIFTQLQTRLRNRAAIVKDETGKEIEHNFMGIVESNPEEGWIRDEFLLRSSKIFASKSVDTSSYDKLKTKKPEKAYNSFLSASVDNTYLPSTFIADTCVGKDERWVRKYIYCYLEVKEGTVYPEFMNCLVDPFPIPKDWLRIYGFDKGWSDATCLVCGAIDPKGICYVYDEYYENQQPITYHGRRVKEKIDGTKMYKSIQSDPSVRNKSDRDGVSYQDYFYQTSGIWLAEANNNILDGIERTRDFMYMGKLKFFTNCVNLKEEAGNYVWKKNRDGLTEDIPVDRFNHLMDALRYMCMGLPLDLRDCYIAETSLDVTKETIMDRIRPDTNIDDLLSMGTDSYGGAFGINAYNMN